MGDAADSHLVQRPRERPALCSPQRCHQDRGDGSWWRRPRTDSRRSGYTSVASDGVFHAASLQVLTVTKAGVCAVLAFHRADLFPRFGLPIDRQQLSR